MEAGILQPDAPGIPQCSAAAFGEFAAFHHKAAVVPEGVAQIEKAVFGGDVCALLEGAFAIGGAVEAAIGRFHVPRTVKRTFLVKRLVLNDLHSCVSVFTLVAAQAAAFFFTLSITPPCQKHTCLYFMPCHSFGA